MDYSTRHRVRVLARGQEFHGGRAFLRQLQVDARRREVDQFAGGVEREVHRVLLAELLELLRVVAADPARGGDAAPARTRRRRRTRPSAGRRPRRTAACRPRRGSGRCDISGRKNCVAPSSDNCARPFCSCLSLSGSRRRARRNSSGAKFGMPVKRQRLAFGEAVADRDRAVVVDADDVARIGGLDDLAVATP